jgi:hypothetical protein
VFVSQQPFGPRTNLLDRRTPLLSMNPPPSDCGRGRRYATTADATPGAPFLCAEPGGKIAYYTAGGARLGASDPNAFRHALGANVVVDRAASSKGSVELLSVGGPLFVANVYGPGHRLSYSLGFAYPAVPPTYL